MIATITWLSLGKPKNQYPAYAANHSDDGKPTQILRKPTETNILKANVRPVPGNENGNHWSQELILPKSPLRT